MLVKMSAYYIGKKMLCKPEKCEVEQSESDGVLEADCCN